MRSTQKILAGAPSETITTPLALQIQPSAPFEYDSADSDGQSTSDLKALLEEQQKDLNKDLLHLVAGSREQSKARVKSKLPSRQEPVSIVNQAKQEDANSVPSRQSARKQAESKSNSQG